MTYVMQIFVNQHTVDQQVGQVA